MACLILSCIYSPSFSWALELNEGALPEYASYLRLPLAAPKKIPVTFGLELEFIHAPTHVAALAAALAFNSNLPLPMELLLLPAEFIFYSQYAHSSIAQLFALRSMRKHIEKQEEIRLDTHFESFRTTTEDVQGTKFWLDFKGDFGVLEVTNRQFPLEEYNEWLEEYIQDHLLYPLKKAGFRDGFFFMGDHISLGLHEGFGTASGLDLLRVRNFIVDFINHSELYFGAFLYDPITGNGPVLESAAQRAWFADELNSLDEKLMAGNLNESDFSEFWNRLFQGKNYALRLHRGMYTGRIEIRSMRVRKRAAALRLVLELLQARVDVLARVQEPIPFLNVGPIQSFGQGVAQFHQYVVGSGLDWNRYRQILPQVWQMSSPRFDHAFRKNPKGLPIHMRCALLLGNR